MQELAAGAKRTVHDIGVVELVAHFSFEVRWETVSFRHQFSFLVRVTTLVSELALSCLNHVAAHLRLLADSIGIFGTFAVSFLLLLRLLIIILRVLILRNVIMCVSQGSVDIEAHRLMLVTSGIAIQVVVLLVERVCLG